MKKNSLANGQIEKHKIDFEKIGLKSGIEIHQQLDTGKLFSRCSSKLTDEKPILKVYRRLRAVSGEEGKTDIAAKHEQERNAGFEYLYHSSDSLIELDEEPPLPMDKETLNLLYQICLLLNTKISDVIQVMRKTVVDGSNTSGFQRTALVGRNGFLNLDFGKIGISSVCIEEDSARIIEKNSEKSIYNLDRLGIPLVEITTLPDMNTPEKVFKVAEYIGMILRSTGRVKRGLGTIRQDLNVSIRNGTRIEIKGAQNLKQFPELVRNEAFRQLKLLEIISEIRKRNAKPQKEIFEITNVFSKTECAFIKSAVKKNDKVLAIKLPLMKGLIGREVQLGKRFGTELSEFAKQKIGISGLIHSDELPNYGIISEEVDTINKILKNKKDDAFVFVVSSREKAEKALKLINERAFLLKIPKEVRRANDDGTTTYLRPMPGSSRMYPETDIPVIKSEYDCIKLPELLISKKKRFIKLGLNEETALKLSKSEYAIVFEELVKFSNPKFTADFLLNSLKDIETRQKGNLELISDEDLINVFRTYYDKKIPKDAIYELLTEKALGKKPNFKKYNSINVNEVEQSVKNMIKKYPLLNEKTLMGELMKEYRGKIDGKKAMELIIKNKKS